MTRAWMVRAGSDGGREQVALSEGRAIAGWPEVPDISHCYTKDDIQQVITATYEKEMSRAVIGNWSGQLWRFKTLISAGDIVVMPLKLVDRSVAIGRVIGDYYYASDEKPGMRHSRKVDWIQPEVSKEKIGADILSSLGSLLTVCEISRPNVIDRFETLLRGLSDPGAIGTLGDKSQEKISELVELVDAHPQRRTIRELIGYWGYLRRTTRIVGEITNELKELGLLAVPSIADGWIDGEVEIRVAPGKSGEESPEQSDTTEKIENADAEAEQVISGGVRYVIDTMDTAHCEVLTVCLDDSLPVAVTKMAINDYSQVAVVDETRRLRGALTWESIALAWMSGTPSKVRQAIRAAPTAAPTDELLAQADVIYQHGFVFVRDDTGGIQGIVTSADLTRRFGNDHRPIVLLDEIERRLGQRVRSRCTDEDLRAANVNVPAYGHTFGTYVKALSKESLWPSLGWTGLDRQQIFETMEQVRLIRNQLMHFSPDPIAESQIQLLERAARTLRLVAPETEN